MVSNHPSDRQGTSSYLGLAMNSRVSPRTLIADYLSRIVELTAAGAIKKLDRPSIRLAMTETQRARYMRAILDELFLQGAKVVTPDALFKAADTAIGCEASQIEARVGLQPGTMNPIHHGHVSASLTAIILKNLDMVALACSGAVPDKPYTVESDVRNQLVRLAIRGQGLKDLIQATQIRQQMVEMFSGDGQDILAAGENPTIRRNNMDMAGFIWLFRANPKVKWTYLVGSDKVAGYGRKGEYDLIVKTLGDRRANAQVVYYPRAGIDINVEKDIAPYDWMMEKWQAGFFDKSPMPTCDLSATKIKKALVERREDVGGIRLVDSLSREVLDYIRTDKTLLISYSREMEKERKKNLPR
ncbi:MAG: hypothetical protein GY839_02125 [candidate division Zixibacteria bacterium]|nr:hypothetical protein [candidate division Zixibacteria bacterium]